MNAPPAPCDGADSGCADDHRWLARGIHDWVGNGASVALRHLDLFEIYRDRCNPAADRQVVDARRAIEQLLNSTRWLVSGLREHFLVSSLDGALQDFVSGANPAGVRTTVTVRGPEQLLPSYRDELFVVVRKALRNAFAYASVLGFEKVLGRYGDQTRSRRILAFLSLDHIGGINTLLHALSQGGTTVTVAERTPERVFASVPVTSEEALRGDFPGGLDRS